MAIWANSTLNTQELSGAFNRMLDLITTDIVVKHTGTLNALLGRKENMPPGIEGFDNIRTVSGVQVEWRMLGKHTAISALTPGAAEIAATNVATFASIDNDFGNATLRLAYLRGDGEPLLWSILEKIRGDEKKTRDYIQDIHTKLTNGWKMAIAGSSHLMSTSAPSVSVFGAIPYVIDDANVYATIDRADATNVNFRSVVTDLGLATVTYDHIRTAMDNVMINGGQIKLIVAPQAQYARLRAEVESFIQTDYNPTWSKFGGAWFQINGAIFVLDQFCPANTILGLDPTSWKMNVKEGRKLFEAQVLSDKECSWMEAAGLIKSKMYGQLICDNPQMNFKLKNAAA